VSPHAVIGVGSQVWWLDRRGIRALTLTSNNSVQVDAEPISRSIDPYIERINWKAAQLARVTLFANRVYFLVPVDNSDT
ncbi:hypothetical protein, partial [Streptococcus pneumoniae]|uniref:hypothetical protein n=1 Tax=Streptococcus pneumoniae TaxID=1313 RepID=UPI001E4D36B4